METQKTHLIRLEKGEEVLSSVLSYVKERGISAGFLTGIGALEKGTLGYFDTQDKKYHEHSIEKVELLSCMGNIAINKDSKDPVAHIHLVVGDKKGNCYGGHLVEAIVSVTVEIYLVETLPTVFRMKDQETALYLLSPKN
jgi:hypothetical protein